MRDATLNTPVKERGAALVTGGRRGIGAASALRLAEAGFDVAIVDTVCDDAAEDTLQKLAQTGRRAHFITGDISAIERHADWVDEIGTALGPVTCLVNNAGVNVPVRGDMLEATADTLDRVLQVNVRGTFFLTQTVARHMIATHADGRPQSIFVVSSANAGMVSPEKALYCISKSSLPMLAKLFAARLATHNIDVYEIQPGLIQTDMNRAVWDSYGEQIEKGVSLTRRWGQPDDVGRTICSLATGMLPFTTGTTVPVGGGLHVHRL